MRINKVYAFFCFWIILIAVAACNTAPDGNESNTENNSSTTLVKDSLSPAAYVNWVENRENGLVKEKNIEDYVFTLLYKPIPYIIAKELKDNINKTVYSKRFSELDGMEYLTFRIEKKGHPDFLKDVQSVDDYNKRVQYFSFDMQKDLSLISGKDTLPCVLFHFENPMGIKSYSTFVLGFEKGKDTTRINDKSLVYNDRILGVGSVHVTIAAKDINRIPVLK